MEVSRPGLHGRNVVMIVLLVSGTELDPAQIQRQNTMEVNAMGK